jgi:hypothetical protein
MNKTPDDRHKVFLTKEPNDISSTTNSRLSKSESYTNQSEDVATNKIQTNISLSQQFDSVLPSESSSMGRNDDKNKSGV